MNTWLRNSLLLIIVGALSVGSAYYFSKGSAPKLAYVDNTRLFSEFTLKKELEMKLKKTKDARQAIVDSLEFGLKFLSKQIQSEKEKDKDKITLFQVKREDYIQKKKQFEEDNEALAKQYDSQIISQMNQYVKDFGNKNGYAYIFGADGSGFLMFSAEQNNITNEVEVYINGRYKGNAE